jgi:hypothetical protein
MIVRIDRSRSDRRVWGRVAPAGAARPTIRFAALCPIRPAWYPVRDSPPGRRPGRASGSGSVRAKTVLAAIGARRSEEPIRLKGLAAEAAAGIPATPAAVQPRNPS